MKREDRYVVLKRSDIQDALTLDEIFDLDELCFKIAARRDDKGKPPLSCVVVESDWPEYEPTWQAIERRVGAEERDRAAHKSFHLNPDSPLTKYIRGFKVDEVSAATRAFHTEYRVNPDYGKPEKSIDLPRDSE